MSVIFYLGYQRHQPTFKAPAGKMFDALVPVESSDEETDAEENV